MAICKSQKSKQALPLRSFQFFGGCEVKNSPEVEGCEDHAYISHITSKFRWHSASNSPENRPGRKARIPFAEIARTSMGFDPEACPCCKTGKMIIVMPFAANAPPNLVRNSNNKLKMNTL